MPITQLLQESEKFELQSYRKPTDIKILRKTHVPFSGSPIKHPYDNDKVILIADPYSTNTFWYEFKTEDISFVEELPNIVDIDGNTVIMARVWVHKLKVGVRCTPFIVEDTTLK
ncbi:MAG: inorganic pyrophosphatase Ppa [Desulfobacterales bacterium]|nr:inorganic pyrophosphatase Ppa [Desulfobacterales bacterium]MDD4073608.1 inorganic pyrophosphatase Ppa [Desulfobacterales bacterium]MDD4392307.1 inorganic pyrophosphatase Ppa [Desulfobacterales bacterium]